MRYLLDTHTLLWFLQDDPQLPERVSKEILDIENRCYVSIASLWEIAIKINLGKLTINFPLGNALPNKKNHAIAWFYMNKL